MYGVEEGDNMNESVKNSGIVFQFLDDSYFPFIYLIFFYGNAPSLKLLSEDQWEGS